MSKCLEVSAASKEGEGNWDGMCEGPVGDIRLGGEGVLEGLTGHGRTPAWTPSEMRNRRRRDLISLYV